MSSVDGQPLRNGLYATATAIVDDKLISFPPAKVRFTKGGKPPKGKKPRKSE
jgi:hypothetical protein